MIHNRLTLLPPESLVRTGPVDHADWNYRPFLGSIQRRRFHLALELLGSQRWRRLLEIGYGSGVFMPELASRCDELYGIDVHQRSEEVAASLSRNGVSARLRSGSATELPFEGRYFDAAVCISALEFVDDIEEACDEIVRVLAGSGVLVVVTPCHSTVLDLGLKLLTGASAKQDFAGRRRNTVSALKQRFSVIASSSFPPFSPSLMRLYQAFKLTPRD